MMEYHSLNGDTLMKRIGLGYIYRINERLHPLTQWEGEKGILDVYSEILSARSLLEEIFNSGNFYGLKTCGPIAGRFYALLGNYSNPTTEQLKTKISASEIKIIAQTAITFETALVEEFGILPSYLVTPKGGYSIDVLTMTPQDLFPADLLDLVPDAKYDIEQAAKCLAFEVPTAAGFHLHRINEAVLRVYWDVVTNKAKRPKERSMGVYLSQLKKKEKGDAKTLATLQQIKDLDRNPISHPDEKLEIDDAIDLYGIIRSAVSRMLGVIRKNNPAVVVPTTTKILQDGEAEKMAEALIAEASNAAKTLKRA